MRFIKILSLWLVLLSAVCAQPNRPKQQQIPGERLSIEYIANEGIIISSASFQILLDAVHRQYKPEYAFTPEYILTKIEAAQIPYKNINLILVSHNHADHFDADSIAMHLQNNGGAMLASSDQVVDAVEKSLGDSDAVKTRLRRIKHAWKESVDLEMDGVKIRFLGLLHANSKIESYRKIQNFGHLIEIEGKKLLHIGDADMFSENFAVFNLQNENIDVVFAPYWFVLSKEGRSLLDKELKAKTIVAVHMPQTDQSETMREILDARPGTVVFSQPGEKLNY